MERPTDKKNLVNIADKLAMELQNKELLPIHLVRGALGLVSICCSEYRDFAKCSVLSKPKSEFVWFANLPHEEGNLKFLDIGKVTSLLRNRIYFL